MNRSIFIETAYIAEDPEAGFGKLMVQTTESGVGFFEDEEAIFVSIPQALALHQKLGQMLQKHQREDGWLPMKPRLSLVPNEGNYNESI